MTIGFVYCLRNPSFPDIYKIGYTDRSPHERARELSKNTGVPTDFDVICYIEIEDASTWETRFHDALEGWRTKSGKEFFQAPLDYVISLFSRNEYACVFVDINASAALAADPAALQSPYLEDGHVF